MKYFILFEERNKLKRIYIGKEALKIYKQNPNSHSLVLSFDFYKMFISANNLKRRIRLFKKDRSLVKIRGEFQKGEFTETQKYWLFTIYDFFKKHYTLTNMTLILHPSFKKKMSSSPVYNKSRDNFLEDIKKCYLQILDIENLYKFPDMAILIRVQI